MEFPASLSAQLSELTDALDDPGTDLQAILDVLIDDLTLAVPSFLGLTMTLRLAGAPVTLTAVDPATVRAVGRRCSCRWTRWPAPARTAWCCSTPGTLTRSRCWPRTPGFCPAWTGRSSSTGICPA